MCIPHSFLDMGVLVCPLNCGQCFPNSNALKKHLDSHLNNVKCPFCFLPIDNVSLLPSHLDECHIKQEADEEEANENQEEEEYDVSDFKYLCNEKPTSQAQLYLVINHNAPSSSAV